MINSSCFFSLSLSSLFGISTNVSHLLTSTHYYSSLHTTIPSTAGSWPRTPKKSSATFPRSSPTTGSARSPSCSSTSGPGHPYWKKSPCSDDITTAWTRSASTSLPHPPRFPSLPNPQLLHNRHQASPLLWWLTVSSRSTRAGPGWSGEETEPWMGTV